MQQRIFCFSYISCAYLLSVYTFLSEFCRFVYNVFHFIQIYTTIHLQVICKKISGGFYMKRTTRNNMLLGKTASLLSAVLCAVLFVCANTNSCFMIHQPQAPDELRKFSKLK